MATPDLVVSPEEVGVDPELVATLLARARREVDEGLLPSCQLALARHGRLVSFEAYGQATRQTRYVMFSCTKAVVAGAVWLLLGEGSLKLDQLVAELIPEFGTNGKDVITIEQVLLHTSGFPRAPMGPPAWFTSEGRRARFGAWRLNWEPGTAYEYHTTSAHWVLAELIEQAAGADYRDFIRQRISDPLGLHDLAVGVPAGQQADIATLVTVGEPASPDELEAILGIRELDFGEVTPENELRFNETAVRALGVPGAGGVTTAADLALYYQALLHNPGPLWDPSVLTDATSNVRVHFLDPLTRVPANRTIGLIVAGDDGKSAMRGLGRTVSPRAFGHNGAGGQVAWADPTTGLSFCYLTNGLDGNWLRQARRGSGLSSRAAVCVAQS